MIDKGPRISENLRMDLVRKVYFFILDILQTLLLVAAFFLVIYLLVMRPYEVKGNSMHPYLKNKEYVLTNLLSKRFFEYKRGDVVVFKSPVDPDKDFIKRVIGAHNDRIMIKKGRVYVNGNQIDETKYLDPSITTNGGSFLKDGEEVIVPENSYFVMGDNRPDSSDSREWGFVTKDHMIGKSLFVYWPVSEAKFVSNPY